LLKLSDYIELVLEAKKLASDAYIHIKTLYDKQYSALQQIKGHVFKQIDKVVNSTADIYITKLHKQGFYSVTLDTFFTYADAYCYCYHEVMQKLYGRFAVVSDTDIVLFIYQDPNTKKIILHWLYEDLLNMHHAYCECIDNECVVLNS